MSSVYMPVQAANTAASSEAKTIACQAFVKGYEHNNATQKEQKQYAQCIDRLSPTQISDTGLIVIKIALVVVIMFGLFIGIKNYLKERDLAFSFLVGVMGLIFFAMTLTILGGVIFILFL